MKAPRKAARPVRLVHPNTASGPVRSSVKATQIRNDSFIPNREKQITATVGANPAPPAQRSRSAGPVDPVAPYSAASPISYSPFGYAGGQWY